MSAISALMRIQLPVLLLLFTITVGNVSSAPLSKDSGDKSKLDLEVENEALSPKLIAFYERLHEAEPGTMESGLIKFRKVLAGSKTSDDFLENISRSNPDVQAQAKAYLAELVHHLQQDYPRILSWLLSTTYGENNAVTKAQLNFLETFSKYDEEMNQSDIWNQYWNYLFRLIGDYIVSQG